MAGGAQSSGELVPLLCCPLLSRPLGTALCQAVLSLEVNPRTPVSPGQGSLAALRTQDLGWHRAPYPCHTLSLPLASVLRARDVSWIHLCLGLGGRGPGWLWVQGNTSL